MVDFNRHGPAEPFCRFPVKLGESVIYPPGNVVVSHRASRLYRSGGIIILAVLGLRFGPNVRESNSNI